MFVGGLIGWSDMLDDKDAWKVLVWFGTLLSLAEGLNRVGFLKWFANQICCFCAGIPGMVAFILFVIVFFISHYMFASLTAHATALYAVFFVAGSALPEMPSRPFALALCYTIGLMGVMNPYATGPAPIDFGSGYIVKKEFWLLGSLFAAIYLLVLLWWAFPISLLSRHRIFRTLKYISVVLDIHRGRKAPLSSNHAD